MRIARVCLQVSKASDLSAFYTQTLGMRVFQTGCTSVLGFETSQCKLELTHGDFETYKPRDDDLFWKIGITLRDLDAAVSHLRSLGCSVSDPHQFRDIGYMAHTRDPQGVLIEFLQTGFMGREQVVDPADHPIAGQATLAHISLRTTNIGSTRHYCESDLGMRLMSIQRVPILNFTLYFFSWSEEQSPDNDIHSVKNREWLWGRPYAMLEIQHIQKPGRAIQKPRKTEAGFAGFEVDGRSCNSDDQIIRAPKLFQRMNCSG